MKLVGRKEGRKEGQEGRRNETGRKKEERKEWQEGTKE